MYDAFKDQEDDIYKLYDSRKLDRKKAFEELNKTLNSSNQIEVPKNKKTIHPYRQRAPLKTVMTTDDTPLKGWNRIIMSRQPHSDFEAEVNKLFDRNYIALNFTTEKERYFKIWSENLALFNEEY